jgi:hypothetical protein
VSNIQSGGGLKSPAFSPANSKGDGGGNGSGGMFFGGMPEEEQQEQPFYMPDKYVDMNDVVFNMPTFGMKPTGLGAWKLQLAKELYQGIRGIPAEPTNYSN